MTRFRPLCLAALLTIVAAALPLPTRSSAHTATHVSASVTSSFDTTITGRTTDKRHVVSVGVQTDDATHTVILSVTINDKQQKGVTGAYQFTLPAGDLVRSSTRAYPRTAVLDTHQHLGAYGHITATWTYGGKGAKIQVFDASLCTGISAAAATTTINRYIATGNMTLALTFPCEGAIAAQFNSASLAIDSGQSLNPDDRGAAIFGNSIYYTAAIAMKRGGPKQILVGALTVTGGSSTFIVAISTDTSAGAGLTGTTHFAVDTLPTSGVTHPNAGSTNVTYNGVLGAATLAFSGSSQTLSSNRPGGCLNTQADEAQRATTVSLQTAAANVSGSVHVGLCGTINASFNNQGHEGITTTSSAVGSGASPTVTATPPTGTTPPTSGTGGGTGATVSVGGLAITSLSPGNGATGVSTSPTIHATFTGTLEAGKITVILAEASNPSGIVMLPAATVDAAHNSMSTTTATALKPQTQYALIVTAMNSSGGLASSQSSFTTGS